MDAPGTAFSPECGTARAGDAASGASGCNFGTPMTGVPIVGSASVGSAGFDEKLCTDVRNAVATGVT